MFHRTGAPAAPVFPLEIPPTTLYPSLMVLKSTPEANPMAEMADHSVDTCELCIWFRAAIRRMRQQPAYTESQNSYLGSCLSRIYDRYDTHLDAHNTEGYDAQEDANA